MNDMPQLSVALNEDRLDRALRRLEGGLFEPLTLADLAQAAGLSAYHFSRQFTARFGVSPITYQRLRRMEAAAWRLVGANPPPLVDLAFDCGFDSQEGFTRAFKRALGVAPGRFRRLGAARKPLEMKVQTTLTRDLIMDPQPVRKGALRIVGVSAVFEEDKKEGIPLLWNRIIGRLPLPGQAGAATFGVCRAAEDCAVHYLAGVAVDASAPVPDGLEAWDLAPRSYLIFRRAMSAGDLHPQMQATVQEIWGVRVPRLPYRLAQAPDLEYYPPDFEPGVEGKTIEWWVPVEN